MKQSTINRIRDLYGYDPVKACRLALKRTAGKEYNDPDERINLLNKVLAGYGTEAIRGEWRNGYWCDIAAVYVNMGDTYAITIVKLRTGGGRWDARYIVASWGDLVERYPKLFNQS